MKRAHGVACAWLRTIATVPIGAARGVQVQVQVQVHACAHIYASHSVWKAPGLSTRSYVWAPKKSRWAWSRFEERRSER